MHNLELEKIKQKLSFIKPTDIFVAGLHHRSLSKIMFFSSSFVSILALSEWKRQRQLSKPLEQENFCILRI